MKYLHGRRDAQPQPPNFKMNDLMSHAQGNGNAALMFACLVPWGMAQVSSTRSRRRRRHVRPPVTLRGHAACTPSTPAMRRCRGGIVCPTI